MATYTSNNYEGRYLQLTITESVNTIANTSTLNWTLQSVGGSVNYYTVDATTVTINGTQVYYKDRTSWDSKVFPAAKGSVSGSLTVAHNSDGSKSITIVFSTRVYVYGSTDYGGTMTLTKIDRSAPTVSISTSGITASGVTVKATASTTCDRWDYSTNGGSSWVNFSTASGTSASKAITGLTPNTSYNICVRARKSSNQVYGSSGNSTIKTLGGSVLSSVSAFTADAATAKITMSVTVYNTSYTHTLVIKNGSTTVLTITGLSLSSGSNTVTLTSSQRSTVLAAMASIKSFTGTFELTTHSSSTQIGTTSSKTATVQTTAANSAPTFSGFTYEDSNTTSAGVTGNNQILIQGVSTLKVTASAATAKNGASISSYSVAAGNATASSTSTTLNAGKITTSGTVPVVVTAIDSRGYTTSTTVNITVVAYESIDIKSYFMRRINEVEDATQVSIEGDITPVKISGANKNSLRYLYYRYKKTSDSSYSSYYVITSKTTYTDTSFSFASDEWLSLDADYSYYVQFLVADKLTSDTVTITIPQGTPLLAFRRKKIGVNKREPTAALDIEGDVKINGSAVDYVETQGTSGIWTYRKWHSGIAECWGRKTVSTAVTSAWGNVYTSGGLTALNVAYPFTFKELPTLTTNLTCNGYGAILMAPGTTPHASTTSTGIFEICRGTAVTNSVAYIVNYHAIGKWK